MIPYGRQSISPEDIQRVVQVLQSDWLTQGPCIEEFEERVKSHCNAGYALACNSATSALHIACMALNLGPGDQLWTSPNTFVASANCALYCGASVDFVDINVSTGNMDVNLLEAKLQQAERRGTLPKVVVPVHFAGQSCCMEPIHHLAQRYGFAILEDACHAIGATYQQQPVGSCAYSHITVFSFHPVKIITTGEGGMALTNDRELFQRMQLLRSHGVTREPSLLGCHDPEPWYYEQVELGYNYRMTDIQAALGTSQLARLEAFVQRRQYLAERYSEGLAHLPLELPFVADERTSAWHLYVIRLKLDELSATRRDIFEGLRAQGVGVNVHYIPVHSQPYYRKLGFAPEQFPHAMDHYVRALSLPLHPGMNEAQQAHIIQSLESLLIHR